VIKVKKFIDQVGLTCFRHASLSVVAATVLSAVAMQASHAASSLVIVPPSKLPAASREYAEAMMLHETAGGTTYLYIEQEQGSKLAVLNVTNPARIRAEKTISLTAAGPFDFVSAVGSRAELIRYRGTGEEAVLDLNKASAPTLDTLPEVTITARAIAADRQNEVLPPAQYEILDASSLQSDAQVANVKGVKQEITNSETGTTFLLADEGLYVVRRPAVEVSAEMVPTNSGG
jgi:hypothetical protein